MPLTKQGDELVHAVAQGGRDEAEAGCVTVDQLRICAREVKGFLKVGLSTQHSLIEKTDGLDHTFYQHGVILLYRTLQACGLINREVNDSKFTLVR